MFMLVLPVLPHTLPLTVRRHVQTKSSSQFTISWHKQYNKLTTSTFKINLFSVVRRSRERKKKHLMGVFIDFPSRNKIK